MKKKRLRYIEEYFVLLSYLVLGFFIVMTGVSILPGMAKNARDGGLAPLFYSLSILFLLCYFWYYKTIKHITKKNE